MTVGLVTHPASLVHDAGRLHPERPERVRAVLAHLEAAGLASRLESHAPEPAPRELVALVHTPAHLDLLERADARGGAQLDPDTRIGPGSLDASLRASQGVADAVQAVLAGRWTAAVSVMRPPGHHATPSRAMGFCLHNHAAVGAAWALAEGGAKRVLVLDWDAHHGNGTQEIFWSEPAVLYASLHQFPYYPGTGAADEVGEGPGRGTTLNVPLPAGSAEDAYTVAMEELILPVAQAFEPDVTIVSAGYDAHHLDPLCMLRLTAGAYFRLARSLSGLGRGPVCVLEGGYDLDGLAWSAGATVSALLGDEAPAGVPPEEEAADTGDPESLRWVAAARELWR